MAEEQSPEDGKSERPEDVTENISQQETIALTEFSNQTSKISKSFVVDLLKLYFFL
jgi:hypothetical protein